MEKKGLGEKLDDFFTSLLVIFSIPVILLAVIKFGPAENEYIKKGFDFLNIERAEESVEESKEVDTPGGADVRIQIESN